MLVVIDYSDQLVVSLVAIEIREGIVFDFYMGFSHMLFLYVYIPFFKLIACGRPNK